MFIEKISTVAVAALVLGSASLATARPAFPPTDDTVSVRVSTADLNINSDQGVRALLNRIHAAAGAVCGASPDSRDLGRAMPYRSCMTNVVKNAVRSSRMSSLSRGDGSGMVVEAAR